MIYLIFNWRDASLSTCVVAVEVPLLDNNKDVDGRAQFTFNLKLQIYFNRLY